MTNLELDPHLASTWTTDTDGGCEPTSEHGDTPGFPGEVLIVGAALDVTGGDEKLVRSLYRIFNATSWTKLRLIGDALTVRDYRLASVHAHALKGLAANVGTERLRKAALRLEMAARQEDTEAVECWMLIVERELGRASQAVTRSLNAS